MRSNLSFPVLKSNSRELPITKIPGLDVAIDMRQVVILVGALFVCWQVCTQASRFVELSVVRVIILCVPVLVIAGLAAFAKYEDRYLEFWVWKRLVRFFAVDTLRWRRHEPGRKQSLRDSIQEKIPTERIVWDMIRCKDGTYVTVLEVDPVKLSLSSEQEQLRVWAGLVMLYHRADFPFVEVTLAKPGDLTPYIRLFEEASAREARSAGKRFAAFSRQHARFLETIVAEHEVFDRQAYVLLHHKPAGAGSEEGRPWWAFWRVDRATPKNAAQLQEEAEEAYHVLTGRAEVFADGLEKMGARLRPLRDLRLLEFLMGQTTGEDPKHGKVPRLYEPVTLFHGPYEKISDRRLQAIVEEMEQSRHAAPPAIGIGNLIINDVSPDAVKIYPDYLRVNSRYHTTMFVTKYPEKLTFGDMQGLLRLPGRIKVVKHMHPIPQEQAVKRIGRQWATNLASEETAADGNVVVENQRRLALESIGEGMDELQTGKQRLYDLTFLIHVEAGSKAGLDSLCAKVRSRLGQHNIEVRLAREEAWEGFVSTLPTGLNLLSPRNAEHPMLTHPLAALCTFGTYQLTQEGGILYGVNPEEGGPVILNNRKLKNYNQVVMGTTGGGKSQAVKAEATRLREIGHRIVIVDPVGDSKYDRVARAVDGMYLVFGVGTDHKFNPFQFRDNYLDLRLVASSDTERDPEKARRKARAAAFDGKILMLTRLIGLMAGGGGLDPDEEGYVQDLLVEVYADREITRDPATHSFTPPTFPEFFEKLAARLESVPELAGLRRRLRPWEAGPYRTVFDAQTNVDLDNKFLVLQLAGLKGRAKGAVMFAVLDFLNGRLSDPSEPSNCFVDEFWALLRDPMAAEFCQEMWRSSRHRNNAMCAITQNVIEFTGSDSGQIILELSGTHLILQQGPKTAAALAEYYGLSEQRKEDLQEYPQGHGLLIVEGRNVPVNILCSPYEMELFNTNPELETEYEQKRLEARERRQVAARKRRRALPSAKAPADRASNGPEPSRRSAAKPVVRHTPAARATTAQASSEAQTRPMPPAPNEPEPPARADETSAGSDGNGARGLPEQSAPKQSAPPEHAPVENGQPRPPTEGAGPLLLPRGRTRPARIFAVVGPTSGPVAYNLAGMLATLGKGSDVRVLFVDAEGDVSQRVFATLIKPEDALPPDDLTVGGDDLDLDRYMARDPVSGLRVMRMVSNEHLPAAGLAGILRGWFDVIVVPCAGFGYAQRWLVLADRVIATAAEPRALADIVATTEDLRGTNGTLLAPVGQLPIEDEALAAHRAFVVPPSSELSAYAAELRGRFAALEDERVGRALTPLLRELLDARHDHHEEVRISR